MKLIVEKAEDGEILVYLETEEHFARVGNTREGRRVSSELLEDDCAMKSMARSSYMVFTVGCTGCGCTDERACDGGCSWASVAPPICSNCVPESGASKKRTRKSVRS